MTLERRCAWCGATYETESSRSRYCSSTCRSRMHRNPRPSALTLAVSQPEPEQEATGVEIALRRELLRHGLVDTVDGQSALRLARVLDDPQSSGHAVAVAAKALALVHERMLRHVADPDDPLEALKARVSVKRRDAQRRWSGGGDAS